MTSSAFMYSRPLFNEILVPKLKQAVPTTPFADHLGEKDIHFREV